jgi:hypothetical protein
MISKIGSDFLKESSRAHDRLWFTLSDAAKKRLVASGVMKSKRVMANGLFKKFHNLNGQGERLKDIKDWSDKTYRVGLDKVRNTKNVSAIVKVPKDDSHILKQYSGYGTDHAKYHNRKGSVPTVSVMTPDISGRMRSKVHKLISKSEDTDLRHNISALHELYESKYLNKMKHIPKEHTIQAPIAKYTGGRKQLPVSSPSMEAKLPGLLADQEGNGARLVSQHASLGVLGREANDLRRIEQAGMDKALKPIKRLRDKSTEHDILQKFTGKKPGVDKYTGKDISKLEKETVNIGNRKLFSRLFNPGAQGYLITK